MNPLQKQITSLREQLDQMAEVRRYLDELLVKRNQRQGVVDRLQTWARQELSDVTELEKNGKRSRDKNGRFDWEAAMEKEKREYLAVMRKVNAAEHQIALLDFEIGVLKEKMDQLPRLEQRLRELLKQHEEKLLRNSQDPRLQEVSAELEKVEMRSARTAEVLEWTRHCLVYLDEIKDHFESMMLLPNWQMIPESKIRLAEDQLERVRDNILEIKKTLNVMKEDWLEVSRVLPPETLPSLQRINKQMNNLHRHTEGFQSKLSKPSHLNRFLAPARRLAFQTLSDLEQSIQQLQVVLRELEERSGELRLEQRKRLARLSGRGDG